MRTNSGRATKDPSSVGRAAARILTVTLVLLSIPLLAMLFTESVAWDALDFIVMGLLLSAVGTAWEVARRVRTGSAYRAGVALALLGLFLLVWTNLAVGLIGSEGNPANLMYIGVLLLASIGAAVGRLEPRAMERLMYIVAATFAVIAVVAVSFGLGGQASGTVEVVGVNAFFIAIFIAAGALFGQASPATPAPVDH